MQTKLTFTLPGIPPAYNKALKINYNLRDVYLTKEARAFKDRLKIHMPYFEIPFKKPKFYIHNKYYSNWFFKNGKPKKRDVQNMNRLLIDAIFSVLGLDDSLLWRVTDEKIHHPNEEFTAVELEVFDAE